MAGWDGRIDDLLYAGEEVLERVGGPDEVVVTTHRVIALTPGGDGANVRAVDRPNVTDLRFTSSGRGWLLVQGVKAAVVGAIMLGAGLTVDLGGAFSGVQATDGAAAVGAGGVLGMLDVLRTGLGWLDLLLRFGGALVFLLGIAASVAYWLTRSSRLVVGVAGDDDLALDGTAFTDADLGRLRTALDRSQSDRRGAAWPGSVD